LIHERKSYLGDGRGKIDFFPFHRDNALDYCFFVCECRILGLLLVIFVVKKAFFCFLGYKLIAHTVIGKPGIHLFATIFLNESWIFRI
jgi:hypothetical protein